MAGSHSVPDAAAIAALWAEPLEGIVLFGSVARNQAWDTSDIDLLVVLPEGAAVLRSLYHRWDQLIGPHFDKRVSPAIVACPGNPQAAGSIWFEAAVDGVVLWDPAGRVSGLLARIRQEIADGKLVRGESHGHPYWFRPEHAA